MTAPPCREHGEAYSNGCPGCMERAIDGLIERVDRLADRVIAFERERGADVPIPAAPSDAIERIQRIERELSRVENYRAAFAGELDRLNESIERVARMITHHAHGSDGRATIPVSVAWRRR